VHDLHERHRPDRVEEVHAEEVLRTMQAFTNLPDRQTAGVGGQQQGSAVLCRGKYRALELEPLGHGLDNEIEAGVDAGEVGHGPQPPGYTCAGVGIELAALDRASGSGDDRVMGSRSLC
jgi:hypothetical protein